MRCPRTRGRPHCRSCSAATIASAWVDHRRGQPCRKVGKKLRVLWLDAHADFNTHNVTPSGQHPRHAGGLPVRPRARANSRTWAATRPRCRPATSARSASAPSTKARSAWCKEHGLDVYDMRYIDEVGMKRAMEAALEGVDETRTCT
jgi:arginase